MPFDSAQGLRCFQDLLDRIAADPELTPEDRQRRASAVRSFLRHTGGDVTAPCDRQAIRTRLERGPCGGKPLSDKTWSNLCTEIRWVMDRYDAPSLQGKNRLMSSAWVSLWAKVKNDRSYIPLSRLVHWASNNGLEPEDIDDEALERYLADLRHRLVKQPDKIHQTTCRVWNRAAARVPSWPQRRLRVPQRREFLSLPIDAFPESFGADLQQYAAVASGQDLLTETTRPQPVRASTLADHLRRLRQLASVQVKAGRPIAEITSLAALFEAPYLEQALQWFLAKDGQKLRRARVELIGMLIGIGKHHLQLPPARLDKLRLIRKRVGTPRQVRMTDNNLALLQQFRDGRNRRAFYSMAQNIFAEIKVKPVTKRTALLAQIAVAHAILTNAPMRFSNLLDLDFERHFRPKGTGPRATWIVSVPRDEVKNEQHLEFELSVATAAMLRLYRERYRPVLAEAQGSTLLFPGRKGGHKHHVTLAQQLCRTVRARTGIRLHPHLYRHIAAYIYLRAHPGDFETVRQLLAHTSIDTTRRFYADFDRFFAQHQYLQVLEGESFGAPA